MQSRGHMQGYLLKRNKEHRKANLLGLKYKRRWVELTIDTLVYASSQQELLTGKIQVFAMKDMLWVRPEAEDKFLVKFRERTLTFKVEGGSSTDRSAWVEALHLCKQRQTKECDTGHDADELEHLRKVVGEQLLDPASPISSASGSMQACTVLLPRSAQPRLSACRGSSPAASLLHAPSAVNHRTTETGARPLSPRSLLASAKAGSAFVSSSSAAEDCWSPDGLCFGDVIDGATDEDCVEGLRSKILEPELDVSSVGSKEEASCSEAEKITARAAASHAPASETFLADSSTNKAISHEVVLFSKSQQEAICGVTDSQLLVVSAAAVPAHSPRGTPLGGSRATSAQAGDKRAVLTRRLTPGVMLINTSTPATPPLSASPTSDPVAAGRHSPLTDLLQTGSGTVLQLGHAQPEPNPKAFGRQTRSGLQTAVSTVQNGGTAEYGQHVDLSASSFESNKDLHDEILRLDPSELSSSSRQCSAHTSDSAPQGLNSSTILPSSVSRSRRPESAPQCTVKRQHTPLKSCLRHGGTAAGSISTPNSNEAVAAAAAAAVAMTVAGSSSPAPGKLVEVSAHKCMQHQKDSSCPEWAQEDLYEADEGGANTQVVCHNAVRSPQVHGVSHQRGGLPTAGHIAAARGSAVDIAGGAVGVQGAALGVKADDFWLEDDFDS